MPITHRRDFLKMLSTASLGAAIGISLEGCSSGGGNRLNFYTWDTYIGENTIGDFEAATNASVNLSYFANNDELFAKIRGGNPGYDLIVPSNDFVERMVEGDLLQPVDHAKLPNLPNIAPEFMDVSYDPGRRYSIPYTWLVTGLGYRQSAMQGVPDSWRWVLDSDRYAGRIGLLGEASELFAIGMLYLGKSASSADPQDIARLSEMLVKQKPNIALFHDDNGQDALLAGDIDLVIEYNGDIAQIMAEDDDIDFVVPREGGILASDCFAIPKGAPNPDLAHQFINFVLDAQNAKHILETIKYPTPNEAALALMPDSYTNNPVIFPEGEGMRKSQYMSNPGLEVNRIIAEELTRIRSS